MNIFLLSPNIRDSCEELAKLDPVRARKQLIECCQLLATIDHIKKGSTDMFKADGTSYKMAHPHHPITKHMVISVANHALCSSVAYCLATIYNKHACANSFNKWWNSHCSKFISGDFCVCRKDYITIYVNTLTEYSDLIRPYVMAKIAANKDKK